ncbi:hypothetical protein M433DRAFT_156933 [Acidomyces richmondensis BFW]|nr:MAG: hypothetical protein FE78DRAFT_93960 [Acidomyces sp. 'richmondensis']KYG43311.1 hypothetical protein M433DRAFT_156933 [Acidomyces richmondensis BFW]
MADLPHRLLFMQAYHYRTPDGTLPVQLRKPPSLRSTVIFSGRPVCPVSFLKPGVVFAMHDILKHSFGANGYMWRRFGSFAELPEVVKLGPGEMNHPCIVHVQGAAWNCYQRRTSVSTLLSTSCASVPFESVKFHKARCIITWTRRVPQRCLHTGYGGHT